MTQKHLFSFFVLAVFIFLSVFTLQQALAEWTDPACPPPGCNSYPPITVGPTPQFKTGNLTITSPTATGTLTSDTLYVRRATILDTDGQTSLIIQRGNVGIGTIDPQGILDVRGVGDVFIKPDSRAGKVQFGGVTNTNGLIGIADVAVYGDLNVQDVPVETATGYSYEQVGTDVDSNINPAYNGTNPDFNWWKTDPATASEFASASSWNAIKLTNAITSNTCNDTSMTTTTDCAAVIVATASAPQFAYDLFMQNSGGSRWSIGYIKYQKKTASRQGGSINAAKGNFSELTARSIDAAVKVTTEDVTSKSMTVDSRNYDYVLKTYSNTDGTDFIGVMGSGTQSTPFNTNRSLLTISSANGIHTNIPLNVLHPGGIYAKNITVRNNLSLPTITIAGDDGKISAREICIGGDCETSWPNAPTPSPDLWASSGNNIYRTTGNIGIGTNSPTSKLHVVGNAFISGPLTINTGSPSDIALSVVGHIRANNFCLGSGSGVGWNNGCVQSWDDLMARADLLQGNGTVGLLTKWTSAKTIGNSGIGETLVSGQNIISLGGDILIGLAQPPSDSGIQGLLGLNGTGKKDLIISGSVRADEICIRGDCRVSWGSGGGSGSGVWSQSGTDLYYSGGNVGIGTNNLASNRALTIQQLAPSSGWLQFKTSTGADKWHFTGFGGGFNFTETGVATHLFVKDGGNVGIGNTNPQQKLDVSGNIRASGNVHASQYCDQNGNNCFSPSGGGSGIAYSQNNARNASGIFLNNPYLEINNLVSGRRYLISVYGGTNTSGSALPRIRLTDCTNGATTYSGQALQTGSFDVNWPDGWMPMSHTFVLTASNSCARASISPTSGGPREGVDSVTVVQLN